MLFSNNAAQVIPVVIGRPVKRHGMGNKRKWCLWGDTIRCNCLYLNFLCWID